MVRWTEVFFTLRDSSTRGNKFKLVKQFSRVNCCVLGRVALVAQRPIVVKLSRGRSVGLSVRRYVRRSVGRSVQCITEKRRIESGCA